MLKKLIIFPFLFVAIHGAGEFSVLQSPSSLKWKGEDILDTGSIRDVISASLGDWTNSNSDWSGLHIKDPLSTPKSSLTIFIDGLEKLELSPEPLISYKTTGDSEIIPADFNAWERETAASEEIVNLDLEKDNDNEHSETFTAIFKANKSRQKVPTNLHPELHSKDKLFLMQIAFIDALAKNISTEKVLPKSLLIKLSISGLASAHGENSNAFEDVKNTLSKSIENFRETVNQVGDGDVLSILITHKSDLLSRSKRDTAPVTKPEEKDLNIGVYYSEDYPAIFNIVLWFMVAFALALIAICYVIADMDPGRDSIIYRMTSTRMKKDN